MELRGIPYSASQAAAMLRGYLGAIEARHGPPERSSGPSHDRRTGQSLFPRLIKTLYKEKGYPRNTRRLAVATLPPLPRTSRPSLLTLKRHRPHDEFLSDILKHRHLEGVRETLQITADHDGRVRCGYSLEAETGRVKCYTSPTGSGANLQTIQKDLRLNYVADEGHHFFQCDLEGADGWTASPLTLRV